MFFDEAVRSRSNEIWKQNWEKWHAFQACQNHFPRKRRKLSGLGSFIELVAMKRTSGTYLPT